MSVENLVASLNLLPHPEGGYYKEVVRFAQQVSFNHSDAADKSFSSGTSIYYLLGSESKGNFSAWHRLNNGLEEVWYYHAGVTITIYTLTEQGELNSHKLGLSSDATPQVVIPSGCWFAAVVEDRDPNAYTLCGCAVFPGFEFAEFEMGERSKLASEFPQHAEIIYRLTRS